MQKFLLGKLKSVVSKKLGAAVTAEVVLAGTGSGVPAGVPTIVWIVIQGISDIAKYYIDTRYGTEGAE